MVLPNLPRFAKIFIVILVDVSSCVLSTWLALYVRLGEFVTLSNHALVAVVLSSFTAILIFSLYGLYKEIFVSAASLFC